MLLWLVHLRQLRLERVLVLRLLADRQMLEVSNRPFQAPFLSDVSSPLYSTSIIAIKHKLTDIYQQLVQPQP
jgi:hypothetical protein